jgi:hypothetical protein
MLLSTIIGNKAAHTQRAADRFVRAFRFWGNNRLLRSLPQEWKENGLVHPGSFGWCVDLGRTAPWP